MDSKSPVKSPLWREFAGNSLFLLIGTAIVLIGLCGFPIYKIKGEDTDEAAKARSLLYSLQSQLRGPQSQIFNQANLDPQPHDEVTRRPLHNHIFSTTDDSNSSIEPESIIPETRPRPQTLKQDFMRPGQFQATGPVLSGIFIDGSATQAVINDTTVVCGSKINGYLVVGIYRNSVLLSKNGTIEELRLQDK